MNSILWNGKMRVENSSLRRIEFMPRNLDKKCRQEFCLWNIGDRSFYDKRTRRVPRNVTQRCRFFKINKLSTALQYMCMSTYQQILCTNSISISIAWGDSIKQEFCVLLSVELTLLTCNVFKYFIPRTEPKLQKLLVCQTAK